MRKLFLLLILLPFATAAQKNLPVAVAVRTAAAPKMDGRLDDPVWSQAQPITTFTQNVPVYNKPTRQKTTVRILYDDNAVFIGAMMYDTHPDSILHQLGNRDDELNADGFTVGFDTYNTQVDAYIFNVTASGVQTDYRMNDETYDAVWTSACQINDSGWVSEIKIPYSALRFPSTDVQVWSMQITRNFRRFREQDEWALVENGASNEMVYWGKLNGISNIKAPLRLSFMPYLSVAGEHYPYNVEGKSNYSGSYSGGLDLKWGVDESFTLDMTLLPDFSQVQSDNLVKNISAFETEYDENRPFFNEGIDLFRKGDHFYSRRIGKEPTLYNAIGDSLEDDEYIRKNPAQAKLLNATKFSGRGKKGTAIGIFNALTDNMYAEISDSLGNTRKVLTEPLSNYNIFVIDQTLKNNSSVFLINTNVTRTKGWDDANVTGAGATLNDKKNKWQVYLNTALSQRFHRNSEDVSDLYENILGYRYLARFGKTEGHLTFYVSREQLSKKFNNNDFGLMYTNDESRHVANITYRIFEPFGLVRNLNVALNFNERARVSTQKVTNFDFTLTNGQTFNNYLSFWDGICVAPLHMYDYYEPRSPGRFYRTEPYYYAYVGFSSDYRRVFALDGQFTWVSDFGTPFRRLEAYLTPLVRPNDKLFFTYTCNLNQNWNEKGYATTDTANVIFGNRDIMEIEQALDARYVFRNNLSLALRLRYYWAMGHYLQFYTLREDGWLEANSSYDGSDAYNFNYNAFNIDLMFRWEFAPGSSLEITYKNAILEDENAVIWNYWDNIKHTFNTDMLNSLSIKALYYLDYQYFRRHRPKS